MNKITNLTKDKLSTFAQSISDTYWKKIETWIDNFLRLEPIPNPNEVDAILLEDRILYSATPMAMLDGAEIEPVDSGVSPELIEAAQAYFDQYVEQECCDDISLEEFPSDSISGDVEESTTQASSGTSRRELILIQGDLFSSTDILASFESINSEIEVQFDVFVIDRLESGFAQIEALLAEYEQIDAIHIFSQSDQHGIEFGSDWLDSHGISQFDIYFENWQASLNSQADIIFYVNTLGSVDSDSLDFDALVSHIAATANADALVLTKSIDENFTHHTWAHEYRSGHIDSNVLIMPIVSSEVTSTRIEVVFLDEGIEDFETLFLDLTNRELDGIQTFVFVISADQDGLEQVNVHLATLSQPVDAIHFISHGTNLAFKLGSTWFDYAAMVAREAEFNAWSGILAADADILFYACELAGSEEGITILHLIAEWTGADIAASEDITGHADLGGNWVLEFSIGQIDAQLVFSADVMANWYGTLDLTAVGGETLVNGATASLQNVTPEVGQHLAMDASGRYVVTWFDERSGNMDVYAKVYNADGSVRVNEFMVHSTQSSLQDWTNVAMADNGTFVVTWSDNRSGNYEVYMRLFNVDGTALTGETMVSTLAGAQDYHSADFAADGSFVVAFQSAADTDIYFQRYNSSGVAEGANTKVNNLTSGTQISRDIAVRDDGSFIVTWSDSVNDGNGTGVYARMFDSSGTALANQFLVNTFTTGNQGYSSISSDSNGNFVITWTSANQDGSGDGIYMKRFDASGTALTGDVLVNTLTANNQQFSHIDMNAAGDFIVTWQDSAADGSGTSVWAQQFDSAGTRIGGQVLVNTTTANNQSTPSVAFHGNSAVVSWGGRGTGDNQGIFLQRYTTTNFSTLTVTTTSNTADGDTSSIAALLNNRGADGQISLREAILAANNSANGTGGPDRIYFSINTGAQIITVTGSDLAALTQAVIIDASTQPGYIGSPLISLVAGAGRQIGLSLEGGSSGSTIRGLNIQGFGSAGINITSNNNLIVGNYLGTNAAGTAAAGNFEGINIWGGTGNIIGGTGANDRNVISGNTNNGMVVGGGAHNTQIIGNYIGVNAAGTGALGNSALGIWAGGSQGLIIGGTTANHRNVISANGAFGILFDNVDNSFVYGNYVGTNAAGTADLNGTTYSVAQSGLVLSNGSSGNQIGNVSVSGARNVFSGNNHFGVEIWDATSINNTISGNYIGTNAAGTAAIGNTSGGFSFWGAGTGNLLVDNLISGNLGMGVYVGNGSTGALIRGNYIGLDVSGTTALANGTDGIRISDASGTQIGNGTVAGRNVISGNSSRGIVIQGAGATLNVVQGNYIGTDATGMNAVGNAGAGIAVWFGAQYNTIGGSAAGAGNVISGNGNDGITISDAGTSNVTVQGNLIGVNATATAKLGNGAQGIWIGGGAASIVIGGAGAGAGNVIGGSAFAGIEVNGATTANVWIYGNFVGTNSTGLVDLGNSIDGIFITNGASNVSIGGTIPGAGNTIAFNGRDGVRIDSTAGTGNAILGNRIYSNTGLGINLVGGSQNGFGVTANDVGDADTGPNGLQNFPVVSAAQSSVLGLTVQGNLNSVASRSFRIEVFASTAADASGHGEGQRYLGTFNVTTDGSGNVTFDQTLNGVSVADGEFISMTATDLTTNNTSEFALAVAAAFVNLAPSALQVTNSTTGGVQINQGGGTDTIFVADNGGAILGGLTSLSMEFQFSLSEANVQHTFLSYAVPGTDNEVYLSTLANGSVRLLLKGIGVTSSAIDFNSLVGTGQHTLSVTWTNAGGNWAMYLDGVLFASGTGFRNAATLAGGGTLVLGNDQDSVGGGYDPAQAFNGTFYDARIFSGVRTAAQIANNYDNTVPYFEPNLRANWTFNDLSTGGVVTDTVSGNNLTLQTINAPGFTASSTNLYLAVQENATAGTVVGTVYGFDAEREARIQQLLAADPSLRYSAETGSFYKLVSTNVSWTTALSAAQSVTLGGVSGNLVTIQSAAENQIVWSLAILHGGEIWIGATDRTVEGEWRWVVDGNDDQYFWQGGVGGYRIDGAYTNWTPSEPSETVPADDYMRLRPSDGRWLDSTNNGFSLGYVIEWNADAVLDSTNALIYSITSQTVAGAFTIDASTGVITVANGTLLDYETQTSHTITVQVTDALGASFSQIMTISLIDVDDQPRDLFAVPTIDNGNVIGYYSFTDSNNLGRDDAGDDQPITLFNNPTQTTGPSGSEAIDFNGTNQYGDIAGLSTGGAMTFAGWVRFDTTGSWQRVFDFGGPNAIGIDNIYVGRLGTSNDLTFTIEQNGVFTHRATAVGAITNGTWLHFAATIDGNGNMVLYVNGVQAATRAAVALTETVRVNNFIGRSNWSDAYLDGAIDNFLIARGVMSAEDVSALYQQNNQFRVVENAIDGTRVGMVFTAHPISGTTYTYSLTDNAGGRFAIDATTGEITVANGSLLDFETATAHTITVQVTDAFGNSYDEQMTINVSNVNEAPTANPDTAIAVEAGGTNNGTAGVNPTGNVLTNDTDPDAGDTKEVIGVSAGVQPLGASPASSPVSGLYGTITIAADGTYTYTVDNTNPTVQALNVGQSLTDTFTYTMQDSGGLTSTTQITITIQGLNDAPYDIIGGPLSVDENVATGTVVGTIVGLDHESTNTERFFEDFESGATGWSNNTTTNATGFTRFLGRFGGSDGTQAVSKTFNFSNGSNPATVEFDLYRLDSWDGENFLVFINDNQVVSISFVQLAFSGASGSSGNVTWTAVPSSTYVNTGFGHWPDQTIRLSLTITDPGTELKVGFGSTLDQDINDESYGIDNLAVMSVGLTYQLLDDADGRFAINSLNGEITVANGSLLNFEASSSHTITVRAIDPAGLTFDKTVTINLNDVNESPTAVADTAIAVEAGGANNGVAGVNPSGNVLTNDTDPDAGDTKTVVGVSAGVQPLAAGSVSAPITGTYGTITIAADGTYTYTLDNDNPTVQALNVGQSLQDVFTYTMEDSGGLTSTTQITITIEGANDAPTLDLNASSGGLGYLAVFTENDPAISVVNSDAVLSDLGEADLTELRITVTGNLDGANERLTIAGQDFPLNANQSFTNITVGGTSFDINYTASTGLVTITQTGGGIVSTADLQTLIRGITYEDLGEIPTAGARAFTFSVIDSGGLASLAAKSTIIVLSVQDALVANNISVTTDEDIVFNGTYVATDADATSIEYALGTNATLGNVVVNPDGTYTYTPNSNANGSDSFTIDVTSRNTQQIAGLFNTGVNQDWTLIAGNVIDANYTLALAPVAGDNAVVYAGQPHTYVANDSNSQWLRPQLSPSNNTYHYQTSFSISADADLASILLSLSVGTDNYLDNILINGQSTGLTYDTFMTLGDFNLNAANFNFYQAGLNTLTFVVRDTGGPTGFRVDNITGFETIIQTETATVSMTINAVNDAPVAVADTAIAVEAGGVANGTAGTNPTGNVLDNDTDVDAGDTKEVVGVSAGVQPLGDSPVSTPVTGTYGTITIAADGTYTYTLDNDNPTVQALNVGQSLQDVFTYTMEDSGGLTSTTQITITIEGRNDEQVIATNTGTTVDEGSTANVITSAMLQTTDVDNTDSQLVYAVTALPTNGALRLSGTALTAGNTFTQADIDAGLVTYDHDDSESPTDSFSFTVDDGSGTASSGTFNFTITNVNDAPVLTPFAPTLPLVEDGSPFTATIASLLGSSVTDSDPGAVEGIAITGLSLDGGTLQYSINGTDWITVSGVSPTSALLLRATDQMRFTPSTTNGGTTLISYHAWDQTSGTAGGLADVSTTGGTTAFSIATDTITVNVTSVNDAPVLENSGDMTLTSITEDNTNNAGQSVASIINSAGGDRITDVDNGSVEGIAITSLTSGNGTWEYSIDGGTNWLAVGTVADDSALLLRSTDLIRFVPNAENGTTAEFTFRAWDQTSGSAGQKVDASVNGGTTAFSTDTDVASILVTDINDAPIVISTPFSIGTTDENTASIPVTVSSFLAGAGYSDVDDGALSGLAITAISGDGTWQYSTDGTTWNEITSVSSTNALLLTSTSQIRYIPNGINGETATFEFRAWDQTSGTASTNGSPAYADPGVGGGTTAYSTATATAQLTVTDVNDAPVITVEPGDLDAVTLVETNPSLQTQGTLTVTDVDIADTVTASVTSAIASGTTSGLLSDNAALLAMLAINTDIIDGASTSGQIAWIFDSGSEAFDFLAVGESLVLTYTIEVVDSPGLTDAKQVTIVVTGTNDAPISQAGVNAAIEDGPAVTGQLIATDVDTSDTHTFTLVTGPSEGSVVVNADGSYTFNPGSDFQDLAVGETRDVTFVYEVEDNHGATSQNTVTITVTGTNDAPNIENPLQSQWAVEDRPFSFTIPANTFADVDAGDTLTYTATLANGDPLPSWLLFDPATGTFSGTPLNEDVGTINVRVTATDSGGLDVSSDFGISIANTADAPTLLTVDASGGLNTAIPLDIAVSSTSLAGDETIYLTISGVPAGATLSAGNDLGGGVWYLTEADLVGLTITPPLNDGSEIVLSVTARANTPFASGALAAYEFDGINPLADSSGNNRDLTEVGPVPFTDGIAELAGTENYLNSDSVAPLSLISDYSISFWARPDSIHRGAVVTLYNGTGQGSLIEFQLDGNLRFLNRPNGGTVGGDNIIVNLPDYANGDWMQVTAVRAGTEMFLYVNGEMVGSAATTSGMWADLDYNIGRLQDTNPIRAFNGGIDRVAIFDRALTAEEIAQEATVRVGTATTQMLTVTVNNNAPVANPDSAIAVEAGGIANGTGGTNPTGNVLTNDTDPDAGDTKTVIGVSAGVQPLGAGPVDTPISGSFGSITIAEDGSYTYTLNNDHADVQALRTADDTLTDVFTYTITDSGGLTSTTQITITIQGANDAPHEITTTGLSVAENGTDGMLVGTVVGLDFDSGDVLTYTLEDDAEGRFTIQAATGQIFVANASLIDYEIASSHQITVRATDLEGTWFEKIKTVTIIDTNDAPVIDPVATFTLHSITEDQLNNTGQTVASIIASGGIGGITDQDAGAVQGLAITALNSGNGSWQYSINGGSTWINVGAVSDSNALLLRESDLIRFVPNGQTGTIAHFTFRGWDQTSGTAGTKVDSSVNGGTTAFSTSDALAEIVVTDVNDAPTLNNSQPFSMTTITEDDLSNPGQSVAAILASNGGNPINDVDGPDSLRGIAIRTTTGNGTWQYSLDDGSTWQNVGNVLNGNALLLRDSDLVRFVPDGENGTNASFTFRAWDQTAGTAGTKVDTSSTNNGGTTSLSNAIGTVNLTVTDVNDAPVVNLGGNFTFTPIAEDTHSAANSGTTIADLIASAGSGVFTDVDNGAVQGIAITGIDNNNGIWFYSLDGDTWVSIADAGVSIAGANDSSALLLDTTALVRFEPRLDYFGEASITFRGWDQTDGSNGQSGVDVSANGGTTAFSASIATAIKQITPVNDAPEFLGANQVDNGTFDAELDGWVASGNVGYSAGLVRFGGFGGGINGQISQTLNTVPGQVYYITFQYGDFSSTQSQSLRLQIQGSESPLNTVITSGVEADTLQPYTFRFVATDTTTTIVFSDESTSHSGVRGYLDNVSVKAVVENVTPISYTEKDPPITIHNQLNLGDIDSTHLLSAVIRIQDNFVAGQDVLSFTNQLGITGSWDAVNGTLTLTGAATIEQYQSALRSVTYHNTSNFPSEAIRTVSFQVNDGEANSIEFTRDVFVTSVNDAPEITIGVNDSANETIAETNSGITAAGSLTVTDLDLPDTVTATVTSVIPAGNSNGLISDNAALLAMLTVNSTPIDGTTETGTIHWSFNSGSEAFDYLAVGESLTLTYTIRVEDPTGDFDTQDITVTITGTNDAPVISIGGSDSAGDSLTVDGGTLTTEGTLSVADLDRSDSVTATVTNFSKSGNTAGLALSDTELEALLSLVDTSIISNTQQSGTIEWVFDSDGYTFGYLGAGESLTLVYTITATDSQNVSATQDITIVIDGVNTAPTITVEPGDRDNDTLVETDDTLATSGTLTVTDINTTDEVTATVTSVVTSGTTTGLIPDNAALLDMLTVDSDVIDGSTETGSITWTFDSRGEPFDFLAVGESLTLTYTIRAEDTQGDFGTYQVTITITGTNDSPQFMPDGSDTWEAELSITGGTLITAGALRVIDLDYSDEVTATISGFTRWGEDTGLTLTDSQLESLLTINSEIIDGSNVEGFVQWTFDSDGYTFDYLGANESITLVYTIRVTDSQGAIDTQTVTIIISGNNAAPDITIQSGDSNSDTLAETDTTLTSTGTLSVLDINTTDTVTAAVTSVSTSGTTAGLQSDEAALLAMLSLVESNVIDGTTETGQITWNFNSGSEAFDYLAAGESLVLTYTITATDSQNDTDTETVTITITGTNDVPTITVVKVTGAVTEDASTPTLTDSGSVTFAEIDETDVISSSVALTSTSTTGPAIPADLATALTSAVTLTQTGTNDGTIVWDFALANSLTQYLADGETVTAIYTITVSDDSGTANDTATQNVTVVITGTNDVPTITVVKVDGAVTEDASTPTLTDSGSITFAEVDETDVISSSVALTNTSTTGPAIPADLETALASAVTLTQTGTNDGTIVWDFALANSLTQYLAAGESVTAVYTITVTDDSGTANNTVTQDVTVVITGTNDAPTITVVDVNGAVTEDASTPTLTDSGSITFAEVDETDVISSSVALSSTSTTGPAIPADLATALTSAVTLTQTGTNDGTIVWDVALANSLTQYLADGETVTAVYTITVSDDSGTANDTATQDVTVVITGTNDVPTISIGGSDSAAETLGVTGATLTTAGSLSVADVDRTDVVTAGVTNFAKSGDLTGLTLSDAQLEAMLSLNADVISNTDQSGVVHWAFDSDGYTFGYLSAGQSITLTYTITVTDSQGATDTQDVLVTITGANTAPNITVETGDSNSDTLVETDSTLTSTGTLSVLDINTTDTVTAAVTSVATSGTTAGLQSDEAALLAMLSLVESNVIDGTTETGQITWNFHSGSEAFDYLAVGESLVLTYTITATDSQNDTDTETVTITITGTNDAPTITVVKVTGAVTEDASTPTLTDSGSVTFAEIDETDVISSSVALTSTSTTGPAIPTDLATALASAVTLTQTGTNDGTIVWDFALANSLTQYLADGETVTAV
ncbi:VCBS domain-containing protein [Pirellulaceae bacterium SH449]